MNLTPLKVYRAPAYPTQEILRQHPELLRVLPRRWHSKPLVLATLAGLLALMEQSCDKAAEKPALTVAPIFIHGKGQAAFGGMGGDRVAFLTEAEARDIIEEEAKKGGVEVVGRGYKLVGVELPITDTFSCLEKVNPRDGKKRQKTKKPSQKGDLELTGWNPSNQVGYKFVTGSDFDAWENKDQKCRSTVSEYDLLDAAERLQIGLKKAKEPGTMGVFYEPAVNPADKIVCPKELQAPPKNGKKYSEEELKSRTEVYDKYNAELDAYSKKASAEELRLQVRDFLAWLKAQGVM